MKSRIQNSGGSLRYGDRWRIRQGIVCPWTSAIKGLSGYICQPPNKFCRADATIIAIRPRTTHDAAVASWHSPTVGISFRSYQNISVAGPMPPFYICIRSTCRIGVLFIPPSVFKLICKAAERMPKFMNKCTLPRSAVWPQAITTTNGGLVISKRRHGDIRPQLIIPSDPTITPAACSVGYNLYHILIICWDKGVCQFSYMCLSKIFGAS